MALTSFTDADPEAHVFARRELATLGTKQFWAKMFPFMEIPFSLWTLTGSAPPRRVGSDLSLEPVVTDGLPLLGPDGPHVGWPLQAGSQVSVCETPGGLFEGCLLLPQLSPARTGITNVFAPNLEPSVPRGARPRGSLRAFVINSKACHQLCNPERAPGAGRLLAAQKLRD